MRKPFPRVELRTFKYYRIEEILGLNLIQYIYAYEDIYNLDEDNEMERFEANFVSLSDLYKKVKMIVGKSGIIDDNFNFNEKQVAEVKAEFADFEKQVMIYKKRPEVIFVDMTVFLHGDLLIEDGKVVR